MSSFTFKFPNYTVDTNAILEIPKTIGQYGDKVLIVGGKKALGESAEKIEKALRESNVNGYESMWYGGECTHNNIDMVSDVVKSGGYNLILGVGGGKALDTTKGAGERAGTPVITIPTIASTCAAVTNISVVYTEAGIFQDVRYLENPPVHTFMDMEVIARSPWKYLWAGMGDTLAKYYEVEIHLREKKLDHSVSLGRQTSPLCAEPIIEYGPKALEDSKNDVDSFELREIVLNNIVTTGLVALLVGQENNGAAGHGLFYGLTALEEIEKNHLHGEVVAYGVLVMLMMDENFEELERLYPLYRNMGWPTSLKDLNLTYDEAFLEPVINKTLENGHTIKTPLEITRDVLWGAIGRLENFKEKI